MSVKPQLEPIPPERWRKNLTDYNEGLGLVYERLMLNDFLEARCARATAVSGI